MRNTQTIPSSETATTGIEKLDGLLRELTIPDLAAVHGCTQAAISVPSLGKRIAAFVASLLRQKQQEGRLDTESERMPLEAWESFVAGIEAAQAAAENA
jgi:hypothetical protein